MRGVQQRSSGNGKQLGHPLCQVRTGWEGLQNGSFAYEDDKQQQVHKRAGGCNEHCSWVAAADERVT